MSLVKCSEPVENFNLIFCYMVLIYMFIDLLVVIVLISRQTGQLLWLECCSSIKEALEFRTEQQGNHRRAGHAALMALRVQGGVAGQGPHGRGVCWAGRDFHPRTLSMVTITVTAVVNVTVIQGSQVA